MFLYLWPLSKLTAHSESPNQPAPHAKTLPRHCLGCSLHACSSSSSSGGDARRGLGACSPPSPPAVCLFLPLSIWETKQKPTMSFVGLGSTMLLAALVALLGVCSAGSDAPRGVAVGFVFDPKAKCDPPCEHAGICIRNNTCFCSRGYEGETCQYGDVTNLFFYKIYISFNAFKM